MNDEEIYNLLNDLLMSYRIVANDNDRMKLSRYYKILNDFIIEYETLQSNWNSLRDCIETDNKRAKEYIKRIRTSDLCHGDYPVEYFYAEKRKEITDYYLDKMNELEGENKQ